MSKCKIEFQLNSTGVQEVLKGEGARSICENYGSNILSSVGDEYEMESHTGQKRNITRIKASTPHAYYSNLKHNTLLKALKG